MNLSYVFRESFSGFKRAKLASTISVFTVTISLTLLGIFAVLSLSFYQVLNEIRSRVEIEMFLNEYITEKKALVLLDDLKRNPAIDSTYYISKVQAATIFKKQFGEDITTVLGDNPLPSSVNLKVGQSYSNLDSLDKLVADLSLLPGVAEVKFNRSFIAGVDRNARIISLITIGLGVFISIAAIALVANTTRLAIFAKRQMIKTMELVGATSGFIRTPFIIEGFWQGLFGSLVSIGTIFLVVNFLLWEFDRDIYNILQNSALLIYPWILLTGIILGLLGSSLSVRKFIN
jgi:cell division transport system permease protein